MNSKSIDADLLEQQITYHNTKYFQENAPEISDVEFDALVNKLKKLRPKSRVLSEIADSKWFNTFEKVTRETPMLSLDKCYSDEEILKWANGIEDAEGYIVMAKIDGCAIELTYSGGRNLVLASTRGDGYCGEDVTLNAFEIDSIPKYLRDSPVAWTTGDIVVRGEVYMKLSVFEAFKSEFANPRNLAAGALRQKFASESKKYALSFVAYDVQCDVNFKTEFKKFEFLHSLGFDVVDHTNIINMELSEAFVEMSEAKKSYDYETDGVVFKAQSISEQKRLGSTSHHPRYAIAYKFTAESQATILKDVKWQVARTGKITPVAIIEPVSLSGATVTNITLHNAARLVELQLGVGDVVLASRRGGVIPHIESVVKRSDFERIALPTFCPGCGGDILNNGVTIDCASPAECAPAKLAGLEHFVKTISCDGFGPSIIQKLFDAGVLYTPGDFYTLSVESLLSAGIGEKLSKKLYGNITAKTTLPLDVFLTAFGIESLGEQTAKAIASKFITLEKVFDELLANPPSAIFEIDGISDKTYENIRDGVLAKSVEIDKVLEFVIVEDVVKKTDQKFSGQTFLFTGKLALPRGKMEKCVTDLGGEISGSVNEKLTYLVVGEDAGSKLEKALNLIAKGAKIQVISEVQFNRLLS